MKRVKRSGSHAIGIGFLKCMSFLNPNCCHVQNFVLTSVSKWKPMIFFARTFIEIMIRKEIREDRKIGVSLNATVKARIIVARRIVTVSFISIVGRGFEFI